MRQREKIQEMLWAVGGRGKFEVTKMNIGIISDTHGNLSRQALQALEGVSRILHAGDIGGPEVLTQLERVAPVTAVRGNTDGAWAREIPLTEMLTLGHKTIYILHDLFALDLEPAAAGIDLVISGHTHRAESRIVKDIVYFNPGTASVPRHGGPLTVGRIRISTNGIHPDIIQIG